MKWHWSEAIPKCFRLILICGLLTFHGCGYVSSGTWVEDDRIWVWAFDELSPPDGVKVNHSHYWRSPHFTTEYIWYFDLTLDQAYAERLTNHEKFRRVPPKEQADVETGGAPSWFLPDGPSGFDVYTPIKDPAFKIYFNPKSMQAYWTKSQL